LYLCTSVLSSFSGDLDDQFDAIDHGAADLTMGRNRRAAGGVPASSRARTVEEAENAEKRARGRALAAESRASSARARCFFCRAVGEYTGFNADHQQQLQQLGHSGPPPSAYVISVGVKAFLALPTKRWLDDLHCLIVPMEHCGAAAGFDAELAEEVSYFQKLIAKMCDRVGKGVIFTETVLRRAGGDGASSNGAAGGRLTAAGMFGGDAFGGVASSGATGPAAGAAQDGFHTAIECVPVRKRDFDVAPSVFRQALSDSDEQWAQHKSCIDTSQRGIKTLPASAAFSYFHVQFGPDPPKGAAPGGAAAAAAGTDGVTPVRIASTGPFALGYGHVIEDKKFFSSQFAAETLCTVMELDSLEALHPRKEDARGREERVRKFREMWHRHDWTRALRR
jgi:hypothetical protein